MADNPKKKDNKTKKVESKPMHKHWPLMSAAVVAVLGLVVVGYLAFRSSTTNDTPDLDSQPVQETPSLGAALEQSDFDKSLTDEQISQHNLSVAAAYMGEGNFDKALEYYLIAEEAGVATTRLYQDVARIYEDRGDTDNRNAYLQKLIDALTQELTKLDDALSKAGNNMIIAETYELLGNSEQAKASYNEVIKLLENYKNSDADMREVAKQTLQYAKDKASQL